MTVTACLLVAAVALGPVPDARRWAPLVAAGVLVVATGAGRWTVVALAPGVVAVVTAIADVPAAGDPSRVAHVAFAAGLAATVAGVVIGGRPPETAATPAGARPKSEPADEERSPISIEVRAVVVTLTAWLLLAPGSWRWAVGDAQALAGWDRAAAVAAATGLIVGGLATVAARPDRAPPTAARYP